MPSRTFSKWLLDSSTSKLLSSVVMADEAESLVSLKVMKSDFSWVIFIINSLVLFDFSSMIRAFFL